MKYIYYQSVLTKSHRQLLSKIENTTKKVKNKIEQEYTENVMIVTIKTHIQTRKIKYNINSNNNK